MQGRSQIGETCKNLGQMDAEWLRLGLVVGPRRGFSLQICRLRKFHLDRVKPLCRLTVMPRRPSTFETTIQDCALALGILACPPRKSLDLRVTCATGIGSDVEVRQRPLKQERNLKPYGVTIIQNRHPVARLYALQFRAQGCVIRYGAWNDARRISTALASGGLFQIGAPSKSVSGTSPVVFWPG